MQKTREACLSQVGTVRKFERTSEYEHECELTFKLP